MSEPMAVELRIPLRNLTLAAKAWGDPSAPPMLAVHGWLDNAGTFDRLAPLLRGHYLVALDLAGHGRSGHRPAANWYAIADYLDEIGQVIDWFAWPSLDLLGHSLGAALASMYAAICPQRIRRLLLVEGLGPLTLDTHKTLEQLRRAHTARAAFKGGGLRVFADLQEAIDARCRSGHLSPQAARCIVERGLQCAGTTCLPPVHAMQPAPGIDAGHCRDERASKGDDTHCRLEQVPGLTGLSWSSDPRLTLPSATRLSEEQLADILPASAAPTLLVLAEPHAPYLQPEMVAARISLLRDIEVVRMAGTHHLHLENPHAVVGAMQDFLARHPLRDT
ncbi:alpha/beta fold hydrolase [Dokdonella sp.]|uniref:alpha/beta fold hydrolase n=1 Tax=Dokdonella sp. TaxID=2291710 RepID=UPI003C77D34F